MHSKPSRHYAFLLRLSQAEPGTAWLLVLKEIDSAQEHLIRDFPSLVSFLEAVTDDGFDQKSFIRRS